MAQFTGKVVVMTGAGRGIGRATAISMAKKGAKVALAARTESQLHEVAEEIAKVGGTALVVPTDVAKVEDCRNLLDVTVQELGGLDILVKARHITGREHPHGPSLLDMSKSLPESR